MKITAAKLIICSPDRNFVTLCIDTDEGIYGLADDTLPPARPTSTPTAKPAPASPSPTSP